MSRSSDNEPPDRLALSLVEPGQTASEVVKLLGAPTLVVELDKRSAYLYDHTTRKTAGLFLLVLIFSNTDARQDRAWIFFDQNDRVTHVGTSLEAARAEYALPWENLYDEIPNRQSERGQ